MKRSSHKVLFVCLGNICRSPAAEGIFFSYAERENLLPYLEIRSCGIGDWHVGQLPDKRMRKAAEARNISLKMRAQQFDPRFLDVFDLILAADKEVLKTLLAASTEETKGKIHLMTAFGDKYKNQEVVDPYYGKEEGFDDVLDVLDDACRGLLSHLFQDRANR